MNTTPPHRSATSSLLPLLTLTASICAVIGVIGGAPVLKTHWDAGLLAVGTLSATGFAIVAARLWRRASKTARFLAAALPAVVATAMVLGVANQVVIDGKVYWRGSVEARAYATATDLRSDLYLLQENQVLLTLSADQGRGLIDAYQDAYAQATAVAVKWNPATTTAPIDGLGDAYVLANRAAAAQAQALQLYLDNLEVFDQQRAAEVSRLYGVTAESYTGSAAQLAYALSAIDIRLPDEVRP